MGEEVKVFEDLVERARAARRQGNEQQAGELLSHAVGMLERAEGLSEVCAADQAFVYSEYADVLASSSDHLSAIPVFCKAHSLLRQSLLDSDTNEDTVLKIKLNRVELKHRSDRRRKKKGSDCIVNTSQDVSSKHEENFSKGKRDTMKDYYKVITPKGSVALTEATCASIASAVATYLFYPVEVLRTRIQATNGTEHDQLSCMNVDATYFDNFVCMYQPLLLEYFSYAVFLRVGYMVLCSFLYVFLFETLKKRTKSFVTGNGFSWLTNFSCSALACVFTVLLTQALDSNIYRNQVSDVDICNWKSAISNLDSMSLVDALLSTLMNIFEAAWCEVSMSLNGVLPSLFLCVNPSLYFTLFDGFKWKYVRYRRKNFHSNNEDERLSGTEAFLLGFISKTIVTIATYPFIRAKVLMVGRGDTYRNISSSLLTETPEEGFTGLLKGMATFVISFPLFQVMMTVADREGVLSLWYGLPLHVIHASTRDAFSMVSICYYCILIIQSSNCNCRPPGKY